MGLRLANGHIARMKALAFGPSQGPAIFNAVSTEFGRLAYLRLAANGISSVLLVIYIDDLLIASPDFPTLLRTRTILDNFATELGVQFKESKDIGFEQPLTTLEYLGVHLHTLPHVHATPTPAKIAEVS